MTMRTWHVSAAMWRTGQAWILSPSSVASICLPPLPALDRHGTVLFDSVTACLSEQMFPGPAPDAGAANRVLRELLDISRYLDHFIAVCDDIWHGGEDYRDWTEVYVRGLADICQGLAAEFDVVCEMTAGLPHLWKGELPRV